MAVQNPLRSNGFFLGQHSSKCADVGKRIFRRAAIFLRKERGVNARTRIKNATATVAPKKWDERGKIVKFFDLVLQSCGICARIPVPMRDLRRWDVASYE